MWFLSVSKVGKKGRSNLNHFRVSRKPAKGILQKSCQKILDQMGTEIEMSPWTGSAYPKTDQIKVSYFSYEDAALKTMD